MARSLDDGPEAPLRVLWLTDSLKGAWRDAQIGPFLKATDPSRISVDLLAIDQAAEPDLAERIQGLSASVRTLGSRARPGPLGILRLLLRARGGYDLIHAHQPHACFWGALAGRLAGVPVVGTLYGEDPDEEGPSEAAGARERRAARALRRWSRRVVAISRAQWDEYVREAVFSRPFVDVVYQGVEPGAVRPEKDDDREWLRAKAGFPEGTLIAATWTSFDDWGHGVDTLLSAASAVLQDMPRARFVISGEGKHRAELQRRVRAKGLNTFVYWAEPDDDTGRILSGADLFIHPSLRDPFPREALEAMAARLPVVGTRVGAVPEIVGSAAVGRLVPRANPEALARAVVELFREPEKLTAMGEEARNRVVQEFSARQWVEEMEEVYRAVVREARSGAPKREWSYARLSVSLLNHGT